MPGIFYAPVGERLWCAARVFYPAICKLPRYIAEYQKFDTQCRNASLKIDRPVPEMNWTKQLLASRVVASRELDESSFQASEARVESEVIYRQTIAQWQADKVEKESQLEQPQGRSTPARGRKEPLLLINGADGWNNYRFRWSG